MVAVVQLSIGLGAPAGGVLFGSNGPAGTFTVSAGLLLAAAVMVRWTARADTQPT